MSPNVTGCVGMFRQPKCRQTIDLRNTDDYAAARRLSRPDSRKNGNLCNQASQMARLPEQANQLLAHGNRMKHLARAVIEAALFLEFSGDDQVDPNSAVRTLENIAHALTGASEEEVAALRTAIAEDLAQRPQQESQRIRRFFQEFLTSCGMDNPK